MPQPLRLLLLPQCPLSHDRGGSKVQLALAEHLRPLGWQVDCLYPFDVERPTHRQLLDGCDVVDWDACHTLARGLLPPTSLSVCRYPLLTLHLAHGKPWPQPLRRQLDPLLDPLRRLRGHSGLRQLERQWLRQAQQALPLADAFAIQNSDDRLCLLQHGIAAGAILQEPCGLSEATLQQLSCLPLAPSQAPRLAFLGTFDYRKGCLDLAWLARRLCRRMPDLRLRLIGTDGLLQGEAAVRRFFPGWLQPRLEVIPRFASADLAHHLLDVSLGVFPSYLEGFGIGIIEQLAAGIPVLAYRAPGPADILPADWLLPRGDRQALLDRLSLLLNDPAGLVPASFRARSIAQPFRWTAIAGRWDGHYRRLLAARRSLHVSTPR